MTDDGKELSEALRAFIDAWIKERTARTIAEIEARLDEEPPLELGPDDVILLGLDGQVDAVMRIPKLGVDRLYRAIRPGPRSWLNQTHDDTRPDVPKAVYRRVGDRLYQREDIH